MAIGMCMKPCLHVGLVWQACLAGLFGWLVWRACLAGLFGGLVWLAYAHPWQDEKNNCQ